MNLFPKPPSIMQSISEFDAWAKNILLKTNPDKLTTKYKNNERTAVTFDFSNPAEHNIINLFPVANEKRTKLCFWSKPHEDPEGKLMRPLSIETHGPQCSSDPLFYHVSFYTCDQNGNNNIHVIDWTWGQQYNRQVNINFSLNVKENLIIDGYSRFNKSICINRADGVSYSMIELANENNAKKFDIMKYSDGDIVFRVAQGVPGQETYITSLKFDVLNGNLHILKNVCLFGIPFAGGGDGVMVIRNCYTAPTSSPSNGGILYVENGALKYRGSDGTVTTIAPA